MTDRPLATRRKTSELRPGDIVHSDGLRLLVPAEGMHQTNHPDRGLGPTYACEAKILNPEYLQTGIGRYLYGGIIPLDGSKPWTIQGNDYRTLTVELDTASSNSRQHYIETGNYMTHGEAAEWSSTTATPANA